VARTLVRTIELGVDVRRPLTARQITTIAGWRDRDEDATTAICRREAVRLARRVRTLDEDLARSRADISELIEQDTPAATRTHRVGAVLAASVLIAGRTPGEGAPKPPWPRWPGPVRSQPGQATPSGIASTAAATDA
jgi:transposase